MKKLVLNLALSLTLWGCATQPTEPAPNSNAPISGEAAPAPSATPANTPAAPPEKIKETKTIKGIFRGFDDADHRQAIIEFAEDNSQDNFLLSGDEALSYFLAANLDKPLELTYNVLERAASGTRGGGTIDKLVAAKAGNLAHDAWWQQEQAANPDAAALRKKYDALVKQATMTDDDK